MNIAVDAGLVGLEGGPIDVAGMMLGKQDRPLGHGQMTSASAESALLIDVPFMTTSSVEISASIHRIGEYVMDRSVCRRDPTDRVFHVPVW